MRLPYPGLRAFTREEADLFFGRERCVDGMIDQLAKSQFLAVLGSSGSGKSSLVRTGLIEALEVGFLADSGSRWQVADMHPGGQPLANLAHGLLVSTGAEARSREDTEILRSFLRRGPKSIIDWCRVGNLPKGSNLLILVDQFEELFRYSAYAQREEAEAFIALLLMCGQQRDVPIHVVLTMRSEYLGACALVPNLAEAINAGLYLTPRMTRAEVREAIVGPPATIGSKIEDALVNRLLNDLAGFAPWEIEQSSEQVQRLTRRADQLPLMQHVLNRLWLRAKTAAATDTQIILGLADYEQIGGLAGALEAHALEILESIGENGAVARQVFRTLVDGADVATAVRRPCAVAQILNETGATREAVLAVLNAFRAAGCNFLQPPGNIPLTDETIIDISHESLIRQWSQLAAWLQDEAQSATSWRRLRQSAEMHATQQGELLAGLDLENLSAWWTKETPTLSWSARYGGGYDQVKRLLDESIAARDRRGQLEKEQKAHEERRIKEETARTAAELKHRRRQNRWMGALTKATTLAALLAGVAMFLSIQSEQAAKRAYDTALEGSELFLSEITTTLRNTPGASPTKISDLLNRGEQFIGKFSNDMSGTRRLARVEAKIALGFAEVQLETELAKEAQTRAEAARRRFEAASGEVTGDDRIVILQLHLLEAEAMDSLSEHEAAIAKAEIVLKELAVIPPNQVTAEQIRLFRAKALYTKSGNLWSNKEYKEALADATACVRLFPEVAEAQRQLTSDARVELARCTNIIALALDDLGDKLNAKLSYVKAEELLVSVAATERHRSARSLHATVLNNLAWINKTEKAFDNARVYFDRSIAMTRDLEAQAPGIPKFGHHLANRLRSKGRTFELQQNYEAALGLYEEAYAKRKELKATTIADKFFFLDALETLLGDMSLSISYLPEFEKNPVLLEKAILYQQEESVVQQMLIDQKSTENRVGNRIHTLSQFVMNSQRLMRLKNIDSRSQLAQAVLTLDAVCGPNGQIEQYPELVKTSIFIRKTCFWYTMQLPGKVEDLKFINERESILIVLETTRLQLEAYVKANKGAWLVERKLGLVSVELARLYNDMGRKQDALGAAQRGAGLNSKEALELISNWFDIGSGPVSANKDEAANFKAKLASRNWSVKRFNVPSDLLWTKANDNFPYPVYVEDPQSSDDDPVERMIYQLETYEGVSISNDAKDSFRKLLKIAKENNVSFVDLTVYALGKGPEASTKAVEKSTKIAQERSKLSKDKQFKEVVSELIERSTKDVGMQQLEQSFMQLLESLPTASDWIAGAHEKIDELRSQDKTKVADLLSNIILDGATSLENQDRVRLLRSRARSRAAKGDQPGAEADYLLALALAPDDSSILNSLGYAWTNADRNLKAAVELLGRAHRLDPDNFHIMDSYAWALLKVGDLAKGRDLLIRAVDGFLKAGDQVNEAEARAHLAEGYRRLGQIESAKFEFEAALRGRPEPEIIRFIETQKKLMGSSADEGKNDEAALVAMASELLTSVSTPTHSLSIDSAGIAILGYDAVDFQISRKPTRGVPRHYKIWQGGVWFFANAANRKAFIENPERFAPAYGGFCAYCVEANHKLHSDPYAWAVHNGKLYLHKSTAFRDGWLKDPEGFIKRADVRWPELANNSVEPAPESAVTKRLTEEIAKQRRR